MSFKGKKLEFCYGNAINRATKLSLTISELQTGPERRSH